MLVIMARKSILFGAVVLFFLTLPLALTTCNSPMGMGDPIDWEPPVLTMDPNPNPKYVKKGTKLSGSVTDNREVDRVIVREAGTTTELFRARLLPNDRWEIDLNFTEADNNRKIATEVVAFDKAGNSGEPSIAAITLIIDISPPIISDSWIQRTVAKAAVLEPWHVLKRLEITDPNGEQSANAIRYQNGWFHIHAQISEQETRVDDVILKIYHIEEDSNTFTDTLLLSLVKDNGSTLYAPRWFIKEEDILQAGVEKFGSSYITDYDNGERYYYRVDIVAYDRAENGTDETEIVEEQNYLCMWVKSDEPKGVLDPQMGTVVSRGTPLPVLFYDDDTLEWAYTDLFTSDQWNDSSYIAQGGESDADKLSWLYDQLVVIKNTGIKNWKESKHGSGFGDIVTELFQGKTTDERWHYVPTGNGEGDYGEYVLFSLVKDNKLSPHTGLGPRQTNRDMWKGRVWRISVIDDNLPLIVFDTTLRSNPGYDNDGYQEITGNTPEENTFPSLRAIKSSVSLDTEEHYFEINGYTLREDSAYYNSITGLGPSGPTPNYVKTFRIAWIPFGMPGGADSHIDNVKKALRSGQNTDFPEGVQWWELWHDLKEEDIVNNTDVDDYETVSGGNYFRRQVFSKRFDILGGADDKKPGWNNFHYNSELENENKLFIFYAVDNMGEQHEVFRQLRLLGNKTPPSLTVYDISGLSGLEDINPPPASSATNFKAYQEEAYGIIKPLVTDTNSTNLRGREAPPYKTYPRGTTLKYWVTAKEGGDIAIEKITMDDITKTPAIPEIGASKVDTLSYCETFPDLDQRVFLFTAEDKLGNRAQIQRTVASTLTAFLQDITTTALESTTYGDGKVIPLRANFSGQVEYAYGPGLARPQLNVRYKNANNVDVITSLNTITTPDTSVLALEFEFVVPVGATYVLETMFESIGDAIAETNRPIKLNGAVITDAIRKEPAFIPAYNMVAWTTESGSLQNSKTIRLDGIHPTILGFNILQTKDPYPESSSSYYYKTNETIGFTLTASKAIEASGAPRIQFNIGSNGPYYAVWQPRSGLGETQMYFGVLVNTANTPVDGEIGNLSINTANGNIVDGVGNTLIISSLSLPASTRLFVDKTAPPAPAFTLGLTSGNVPNVGVNPDTVIPINQNPTLAIPDPTTAAEPYGVTKWYSTDGGLTWTEYTAQLTPITANGTYDMATRYIDRAGNIGAQSRQKIQVNAQFPKLVSVNAEQPNGTYVRGQSLRFILGFDDAVTVPAGGTATITLRDRTEPNATYRNVTRNATVNTTLSSTVIVDWQLNGDWEMPNGLYISEVNFTGMRDSFNNAGVQSTAATNTANIVMPNTGGITGTYNCANLGTGLIVDTVAPSVTTYSPANAAGRTGDVRTSVSADNKTITLTFRERVMAGNGTITIRPYGTYLIPPVFENEGYTNTDGTWVAGFYEIYNNNALTAADRTALTRGTSMSALELDTRTGQSVGPYVKMTQGLKAGAGYSGNYNNTTPGPNGPNPLTGFMIPDTATKWVLDYRYSIDNNNNTNYVNTTNQSVTADATVVPAIRAVLTKVKWRWQELDVVSSTSGNGDTVIIINLAEPLHKGLQWGLHYPQGAFTDMAGNPAPALGYEANGTMSTNSSHWFWSSGVQTPVVRVNRKSFDARTADWATPTANNNTLIDRYNAPASVPGPGGWGIVDFNTVHYRIETETPGQRVRISYGTIEGKNVMHPTSTTVPIGSVIAAGGASNVGWGVTVDYAGTATGTTGTRSWNTTTNNTNGEWVRPNLIRRTNGGTPNSYQVVEAPGFPTVTRNFEGTYRGYRSHNKDATMTDINNVTLGTLTGGTSNTGVSNGTNNFTYTALEASKNYVVAMAQIDHQSAGTGYTTPTYASIRGYEGVFRSVVALMQGQNGSIVVEGSNIKNGMPSIAGFPVQDAAEAGDSRFVKYFFRDTTQNQQFYWVSTEIVSQWYFIKFGQGTHQNVGEVNNYLTAGYGDLSFGYQITSYN